MVGDGDHTVPNPIPPPHFRKMMPPGMAFQRNARVPVVSHPYTHVGDGDHTVPNPIALQIMRCCDMLPNRKKNRLIGYSYSQPGAYFITVCTQERKRILGNVVGGDDHISPYTQLTETGKIVEKYTKTVPGIDRYVIMPDHVHMILRVSAERPTEGPMWPTAPVCKDIEATIRTWKTLITKALGVSIWQRSYYDHIIRSEKDYWETVEYIEGNPAKWYYGRT